MKNMTMIFNRHKQLEKRRYLRKNSTVPERKLWLRLKNKQLGARFRRQYGIGSYVVDFCSPRIKLIIELDGGIHDEYNQRDYDIDRQENIEEIGFDILRFTNEEINNNMDRVINKIKKHISDKSA